MGKGKLMPAKKKEKKNQAISFEKEIQIDYASMISIGPKWSSVSVS